jgi:phage protein D
MRLARRFAVIVAVLALMSSAALVFAQQAPGTASGQLVRVDGRTITIKTDSGGQMVFTYNDRTAVTGTNEHVESLASNEDVDGLAAMPGANVTVHYRTVANNNMAIQVDVHPKR